MVWIKATGEDFATVGVEITSEEEIEGKYIKHITLFTAEQLNEMRLDTAKFEFVEDIPAEQEILQPPEEIPGEGAAL